MSKQIYIDSNGNEVLVSGTITNDNNLPHYTGTPTAGSTAYEIASKQDKSILNIVEHFDSGSSSDAINAIITEYGKNNMMFAFDIPLGYYTGIMIFNSSSTGSGYIIQSSTMRFWVVYYLNGTISLTEKT